MEERLHFDNLTLCPDYRFIRVITQEGVFYDVVRKWASRAHIFELEKHCPKAESLGRAFVPPCIFRDFTELAEPGSYREAVWKDGETFLFPLEPKDRQIVDAWKNKNP